MLTIIVMGWLIHESLIRLMCVGSKIKIKFHLLSDEKIYSGFNLVTSKRSSPVSEIRKRFFLNLGPLGIELLSQQKMQIYSQLMNALFWMQQLYTFNKIKTLFLSCLLNWKERLSTNIIPLKRVEIELPRLSQLKMAFPNMITDMCRRRVRPEPGQIPASRRHHDQLPEPHPVHQGSFNQKQAQQPQHHNCVHPDLPAEVLHF